MIMPKRIVIILGGIVVVAAVLRLWNLGTVPFRADEFLDINATVGYARTGVWQAWDHNMGAVSTRINPESDVRAWPYRIQVAQIFHVLPPTEAVARSVSVVWGIITVLVVYLVATSLTRRREIGLIAAALWAVSVSGIEMSRTLRMYAMFAPVYLLFSWMVFLSLERDGRWYWVRRLRSYTGLHIPYAMGALVMGVLAFSLHALTGMIVLSTAVYVAVMAFVTYRNGVTWRDNRYLRVAALGALALMLATVAAPDRVASLRAGLVLFEDHWSYIAHSLRDFQHPLLAVLVYAYGIGMLWFRGVGSYQRRGALWIDTTVGVTLCSAIFLWSRNVGPQYIYYVQPFITIGVASGVYMLARYLQSQLYGSRVFAIVIALAFILLPQWGYFLQENNTYHITSRADQPNYRKVFSYVVKHRQSNDVLITRNFRNYYWSGAKIPVYDFGSERSAAALRAEGKVKKITLPYIQSLMARHPSGWIVLADNDWVFVSKDARRFIERTLSRVSHSTVRGPITIYRWGNDDE